MSVVVEEFWNKMLESKVVWQGQEFQKGGIVQ